MCVGGSRDPPQRSRKDLSPYRAQRGIARNCPDELCLLSLFFSAAYRHGLPWGTGGIGGGRMWERGGPRRRAHQRFRAPLREFPGGGGDAAGERCGQRGGSPSLVNLPCRRFMTDWLGCQGGAKGCITRYRTEEMGGGCAGRASDARRGRRPPLWE